MWCGTWNIGAVDPFQALGDLSVNSDEVARLLSPFVPKGLDVYVLGIQEGVCDKVYEAVEQYTGCFRLPLHRRLYSARTAAQEAQGARRSRRMGNAIRVQAFINDAKANITPDPLANTADMVRFFTGAALPPSPPLTPLQPSSTTLFVCVPRARALCVCCSWIAFGVEGMGRCSRQSTRA